MKRLVGGGLSLVVALCGGCAAPPVVGDPAPKVSDSAQESAYRAAFDKETVQRQVYALFDTRMFVAATFLSTAFREARVRRIAAFQKIPPGEVQSRIAEERAEREKYDDFIVGVHMNEPRYDDFGRTNSIWRVVLETASGEVKPESVKRLGRADLNLRALYPTMGTFWVAYRFRFPSSVPVRDGQPMTLRISSNVGRAELTYPAR